MDDLQKTFPIIPHESAGVDCCGCIVVTVTGNDVELTCNECSAVVGVIQLGILNDLVSFNSDVSLKDGTEVWSPHQLIELTPRSATLWQEWTQNTG